MPIGHEDHQRIAAAVAPALASALDQPVDLARCQVFRSRPERALVGRPGARRAILSPSLLGGS
jgi:hypothetical protein